MKKYHQIIFAISVFFILSLMGCEGFLDEKPTKDIVVPNSLDALEAILDNHADLNRGLTLPLICADDYVTTLAGLAVYTPQWQRNAYLWQESPFSPDETVSEWSWPYKQVFYANVVLDELERIQDKDAPREAAIRGAAYFFRAWGYYNLSQVFLPAYSSPLSANEDYSIPMKQVPGIEVPFTMGTVNEVYEQIMDDLAMALELLPETSQYRTRPTKLMVKSLLARIYLSMEEYELALFYADQTLQYPHSLMDYNEIENRINPFAQFNEEVIFHAVMLQYTLNVVPTTLIEPTLYGSYAVDDLRKDLFFTIRANGNINFTGSYAGNFETFCGLAFNEIYLISSESKARLGDMQGAITDLNTLLIKRHLPGFEVFETSEIDVLLGKIIDERRKELVFRGLRWSDLRRINLDERFQKILKREIDGVEYTLDPNSSRYIFPIPPREQAFN
ncbi:RagB/SusD family nutrient uptake outer membrane protein [Belliella kenyensis]|uniref:RagB/SusD family nutrient uptake outer membrane protein n=1 Tax=Belliella kenyensis TaxID=1472724 RepID=A0ABV8EMY9_9BACT|nr:RagB/SusD family nutrient uptake outer membrane protein [Belliella kenyensis]MCH7400875.1 RagB/SusD family nutrient uptake outer membrane protein [Belliella kenyensis]MDN3601838.1 RagB/SusD family nutrient uptake outer membrane protein [Belliella kenyensis]